MTDNNGSRPIIEPIPSTEAAADTKKLTMKGLKLELDDLSEFIDGDVLGKILELTDAVQAHNEALKILGEIQANLQEAIYALGEATLAPSPSVLPQALETLEEPEPIPEPIPEPEPEPEDLQFGTHQHVVLETIADSCIVMNDILLLCKAMKKVPELTDQTRIALLDLAGRRAGIEIQPGMQVRAGIKMIVA